MTRRPGFILLYSLLLILALSVLSAGMMALALRERQIARVHGQLIQTRAVAESAARVTVAEWAGVAEGIAVGETRVLTDSGSVRTTATRLAPSLYLVKAAATIGDGGGGESPASGKVGASMLVRSPDAALILESFPAAVTGDSLIEILNGTVSGWDACGSSEGPAPGAMAPRIVVNGLPPDGVPPVSELAPPPRPVGDPLAPDVVQAIRDRAPAGSILAAPQGSGDDCLAGPSNWGAVSPGHPCHEILPLIGAGDVIVVEAGEARGILVGFGDVRLEGPLEFEGLILATGQLTIGADVQVRGAVRAHHVLLNGGAVVLDRCAQQAMLAAPAFTKPLRPVSRWWVPSF